MVIKKKPIPKGMHSVTPALTIKGADKAIAFYKKALGAKEKSRMDHGGKVMHAELQIGDSVIMLGDECPEYNNSPQSLGGTTFCLFVYVDDVDATVKQAIAAGAKLKKPVEDQFWGDRCGTFVDPFGHMWMIATHVEDVSPEEIKERMMAFVNKG